MVRKFLTALTASLIIFAGPARAAILVDSVGPAPDRDAGAPAIDEAIADTALTAGGRDLLSDLLSRDAGTTSGMDIVLETSLVVFRGQIDLSGAVEDLPVGSDDGFAPSIGGEAVPRHTHLDGLSAAEIEGAGGLGLRAFERVHFGGTGGSHLSFRSAGTVSEIHQTPLPGGAPLLLGGLGMAAGLRAFRRRRSF